MIAVICNRPKAADSWEKAMVEEFGRDQVQRYPDLHSKDKIEIAVCWKAEEKLLHQFPSLKLIQSVGAGVDHIFATNNYVHGTKISRIIDPNLSKDMYEFILLCILNELKNLTKYSDQQGAKIWDQHRYKTIPETTVSLLGLGVIGKYVAVQLKKQGFKVKGWSKSSKIIEGVDTYNEVNGLNEMLRQSDYLINILPSTEATFEIIDSKLLSSCKAGCYLINVGRGPQVKDEDLIKMIDQGHISGATLDVFHKEPLDPSHPFWTHPKVLVTPHIASITNIKTARAQVIENIYRIRDGRSILNEVDPIKTY